MDLFDKLKTTVDPLGRYRKDGHGYYFFPKLEGEIGAHMMYQGKEVLTWSVNNYIGLANHPEVRKADAEAAKEWGLAYPMGARMMTGQTSKHEELEKKLADFVGKKSCYLLNYGYQGMVSIIDCLVDRNDVIVYDSECHACIMDGIFLHKAKGGKSYVFAHNDMEKCEKMLGFAKKKTEETGGGVLVITEGVFGMAGDLGNLKAITDLKDKFEFKLLVDDAHGFGTMGKSGAGTGEHFGNQDKIDLYFSTFAKSMAGIGAFIASNDEDIIWMLMYRMRSQVFAKSLPMPMVIGGLKRLELLQNETSLRENLWTVVNALQTGLKENGLDIGKTESPVTPVYLKGNTEQGANVVLDLRQNYGIFCSIVIYPVIPKGIVLARLIPTAVHTLEDVERTVKAFSEVKEKLDNQVYNTEKVGVSINK